MALLCGPARQPDAAQAACYKAAARQTHRAAEVVQISLTSATDAVGQSHLYAERSRSIILGALTKDG
jgi:hypothetical protein